MFVIYLVTKLRQSELVSDSHYFSVPIAVFIMSFLFSIEILKRVQYDVVFVVYFVIKLRQSEPVSDSHYFSVAIAAFIMSFYFLV